MVLDKILSAAVGLLGCLTNGFSFSYFLLNERTGLTNQLFIILSLWDFLSCLMFTTLFWLNRSYIIHSVRIAVTYCSGTTVITVAVTRAIMVCNPFYHINRKFFWGVLTTSFLYHLIMRPAQGYMILDDSDLVTLNPWQIFGLIETSLMNVLYLIGVFICNVICLAKLLKPGPIPLSPSSREAAKTVLMLSALFLFSKSALVLYLARNMKHAIEGPNVKLIDEWSKTASIVVQFLFISDSMCNPILYFIRNRNMRRWLVKLCKCSRGT